jgi:hypothetical protein
MARKKSQNAGTDTILTGTQAASYMRDGGLVPDPLILNLILSELKSRKWVSTF